jgi:hypothetical protein
MPNIERLRSLLPIATTRTQVMVCGLSPWAGSITSSFTMPSSSWTHTFGWRHLPPCLERSFRPVLS